MSNQLNISKIPSLRVLIIVIGLLGSAVYLFLLKDEVVPLNFQRENIKLYKSKHYHYQVSIPPGFQFIEMGSQFGRNPDSYVLFVEKDPNSFQQKHSGQFVLMVRDDIKSLDEYLQRRRTLINHIDNIRISETSVEIDGVVGIQFISIGKYNCPDPRNPKSVNYLPCRSFTSIWQRGNLTYEFSGTVFGDSDYQKYWELYTQVLRSFHFTN